MRATIFLTVLVLLFTGAAAEISGQTTAADLFQEAERRFSAEDYSLALNLYDRIIEQYPTSRFQLESRYKKGIVLYQTARFTEALEIFESLSRPRTGGQFSEPSVFWAGMCTYELGSYGDAAGLFGSYLTAEDKRYYEKARLYRGLALGRDDRAEAALEVLSEVYGSPARIGREPEGFLFYCGLLLRESRFDELLEAVETGKSEVSRTGSADRLILYEAEALWGLGRKDDAEELYRSILDSEAALASAAIQRLFVYYLEIDAPDRLQDLVVTAETELAGKPEVLSKLWTRLGIQYFDDDRLDLASSYFLRAWLKREEVPVPEAVPVYLAEIYVRRNEKDRAEQILGDYISDSAGGTLQSTVKLGQVYLSMERWGDAERTFMNALDTGPPTALAGEIRYQLAYSRWKLGKPEAALATLEEVLASATSTNLSAKSLRLKAIILYSRDRFAEAEDTLEDYLSFRGDDIEAALDLMKIYFRRGEYGEVIEGVQNIYERNPDFENEAPGQELMARYLLGIASIPGREYARAIDILEGIEEEEAAEIPEVFPSVLFYRGWAYYRLSEYAAALNYFDRLITEYPSHELVGRSVYFAGWCEYTRERYSQAAERFRWFFQDKAEKELREKGLFMLGKSLFNELAFEEAALMFQKLYVDFPDSPLADDAMFEYADSLLRLGDVEESINSYERVYRSYPNSNLVEEAMYRRGEILYSEERFIPARNAFYEYRTNFPEGKLTDASLYWGGMAYLRTEEPYGALLLWERLIDSFPDSTFRPDAIAESARIYGESGDLRKAMDLYNLLIASYPSEAASVGARQQLSELEHLLSGSTEAEAELAALIGTEGGAATETGREAMLELSRIYIFKDRSRAEVNRAVDMLQRVLDRKSEDPAAAAEARFLMGEYYYRRGDLEAAGAAFLSAATIYPRDRDLLAESIYRAAEMTLRAGNLSEARQLIGRLENNFPDSQWALEGRRLLRRDSR